MARLICHSSRSQNDKYHVDGVDFKSEVKFVKPVMTVWLKGTSELETVST